MAGDDMTRLVLKDNGGRGPDDHRIQGTDMRPHSSGEWLGHQFSAHFTASSVRRRL